MKRFKGVRWTILALMCLGTIVNYTDRNTLGVLAPILRQQLHFTTAQYSYVVSVFQFCYGLMQPVAGFIADTVGLRFGYFMFALAWGTVAALHALAGSWQGMAFFRGLLGFSEAAAIPAGVKTASLWFPARERSIATGWFNSGSSIGAMIAPPLVIWLSLTWSWRAAFVVTGLMGVAMSLLWLAFYRDPERHRGLSAEERALILSDQEPSTGTRPSPRRVLAKRRFWGIAAARFLTEPAWQTFVFWIPLYMVSVRGMDIKHFALFGWLPFLAADFGCVFSGYLSPLLARRFRISLKNSRIAGIGLGCVCMIGPGLIGLVASPIGAILLFSLGGFAHQTLSSLLYAVVTDNFEKQDMATATGCAAMVGYIGGTSFTLILGQLAGRIGYGPLLAALPALDLVAFAIVVLLLWRREGEEGNGFALDPSCEARSRATGP